LIRDLSTGLSSRTQSDQFKYNLNKLVNFSLDASKKDESIIKNGVVLNRNKVSSSFYSRWHISQVVVGSYLRFL
jgi:hypothetical protein